jgi:fucose 4-O-acetylase-like acetyltransferase
MIAIVAGHVWVTAHPLRELLYSWHVPVFFVLTGYLWKPQRSFGTEAKNRTLTLLVPYVVWLALLGGFTLWLALVNGNLHVDRVERVLWGGQFAAGAPFWPIWFVTTLYAAALIYRALSRAPLPLQWLIAIVLASLALYLPGQPLKYLPLGIGLALPGLLFVLAGVTFRRVRPRLRRPLLTSLALLVPAFALAGFGVSRPLDMKRLDLGTLVLSAVVAVAISVGLILLAEWIFDGRDALSGIITPLAQASLVVLFLHTPIIVVLRQTATPKPVVLLLALVISWGIGLALLRVRGAWVLTGVLPRQPRAAPVT